jgi:hypothetical protein
MRYVELRRHTDNDGDRLTAQGAADAEAIGRDRLHPPYAAFVSTGAARATQMLEILRHAAGQDEMPITSATGLRSPAEDRWRQAAKAAGKGANLDAIGTVDPDLVERESFLLGSVLLQVVQALPEGGRAPWWQPHQRGGRAWAGRPGYPAGRQGQRSPADRGGRELPAATIGLNGGKRAACSAASNGERDRAPRHTGTSHQLRASQDRHSRCPASPAPQLKHASITIIRNAASGEAEGPRTRP